MGEAAGGGIGGLLRSADPRYWAVRSPRHALQRARAAGRMALGCGDPEESVWGIVALRMD